MSPGFSLSRADLRALKQLDAVCTDWTVHNRDYWRPYFNLRAVIRYEVRCSHFFSVGSGVGRTLEEAVNRAMANMFRRHNRIQFVSEQDMEA